MFSSKPFLLSAAVLLGPGAGASARPVAPPAFTLRTFASTPKSATGADDIAYLEGHVFVGWQNGVGTKGEPAAKTHRTTSTLVEYGRTGRPLSEWSLRGKLDGLGGDPSLNSVIATVNEDGNSSLYKVKPSAAGSRQVVHYTYSPAPDGKGGGGLRSGGGTDAVVVSGSTILISASAPTRSGRTAAFRVQLRGLRIAQLLPTFSDSATATDAVSGNRVKLKLTDPDSNAVVPAAT